MRQNVEFDAEGTMLRGWLYTSDAADGPYPAVVVTHGFGAVKEQYTDLISEALAAAGCAALLYDHSGFGASDGQPRQEIDPWAQINGYRHAITYLWTRPEIDSGRIGVLGTSYSGGHVLIVAAMDQRVKCVYSQVPVVSGGTTLSRFVSSEALVGLRQLFNQDREARFLGAPPAMIPLITEDPNPMAALADRETYEGRLGPHCARWTPAAAWPVALRRVRSWLTPWRELRRACGRGRPRRRPDRCGSCLTGWLAGSRSTCTFRPDQQTTAQAVMPFTAGVVDFLRGLETETARRVP